MDDPYTGFEIVTNDPTHWPVRIWRNGSVDVVVLKKEDFPTLEDVGKWLMAREAVDIDIEDGCRER